MRSVGRKLAAPAINASISGTVISVTMVLSFQLGKVGQADMAELRIHLLPGPSGLKTDQDATVVPGAALAEADSDLQRREYIGLARSLGVGSYTPTTV